MNVYNDIINDNINILHTINNNILKNKIIINIINYLNSDINDISSYDNNTINNFIDYFRYICEKNIDINNKTKKISYCLYKTFNINDCNLNWYIASDLIKYIPFIETDLDNKNKNFMSYFRDIYKEKNIDIYNKTKKIAYYLYKTYDIDDCNLNWNVASSLINNVSNNEVDINNNIKKNTIFKNIIIVKKFYNLNNKINKIIYHNDHTIEHFLDNFKNIYNENLNEFNKTEKISYYLYESFNIKDDKFNWFLAINLINSIKFIDVPKFLCVI